jgi:hypothetical protein
LCRIAGITMPNEEDKKKISPADQVLKRFRSSSVSEKSSKKRKLSGGVLFINLLLLALLILLYVNKKQPEDYGTSVFKYKGLQFRFSEARNRESGNYYFSLTIKSLNEKDTTLHFHDHLARIVLYQNDTPVYTMPFGEHVRTLTVKPGGTKTLAEMLEASVLKKIYERRSGNARHKGRSLLGLGKKRMPLVAEIELNTDDGISTSLPFSYEVD